ncbi:alpha/beta fold hydrolase [Pedobacter sp. PWIIR3]
MSARIYFISGLGADSRAFRKLVLPKRYEVIHLNWIEPEKNESLESYANRLSKGIDQSVPFYLVGLSFGGMIATEITKQLKPLHTFLISSTPIYRELPWYYKFAGQLRLQKLVPFSAIKTTNGLGLKFMGAKTQDELKLLKQLIVDSDPKFIKWALNCILEWRNLERPANVTHIHGNADTVLPIKYNKPDIVINGGGHFMVYANGDEITEIISSYLS